MSQYNKESIDQLNDYKLLKNFSVPYTYYIFLLSAPMSVLNIGEL